MSRWIASSSRLGASTDDDFVYIVRTSPSEISRDCYSIASSIRHLDLIINLSYSLAFQYYHRKFES